MPTGYTYAVQNGEITTLRQFALKCARGMGACIMMRDMPSDAPIPERFEPQTKYHDEAIAKARVELENATHRSMADWKAEASKAYEGELQSHAKREADRTAEKRRYEFMLGQVREWKTEAEGIRSFMISQLEESIRFDCSGGGYNTAPIMQTAEQYRDRVLATASKDLAYHTKSRLEEITRTDERNEWLSKLRASLPEE